MMQYPGDRDDDLDYQDDEGEVSWAEEEQLDLADDDEDLPWLEAEEYEEEGGFDWSLIRLIAIAAVTLAIVLGLIWWLFRDRPDPEMVPDGSTIEAPDEPYKERPEEGSGAEVEGTGSQAFQRGEGEQERGRLEADDGGDSPRPSIDREQAGGESSDADETPSDSGNSVYVQIGAFGSNADAEAAWTQATQRYSVLSGKRHRVLQAEVNGATVYRLQVIASDRASADATCRSIRNAGGDCYIR